MNLALIELSSDVLPYETEEKSGCLLFEFKSLFQYSISKSLFIHETNSGLDLKN